ncbi:MAG: hypothetical protein HYY40_11715 [Bacteroidetes bacterium]|nr:hypothetical protein [Bacteroidota bacterium]
MKDYTSTPLEPQTVYHIYNHANGSDNLFAGDDNYSFFMNRYKKYIVPIADTFCYCLMPNHIHFLMRLKDETALEEHFRKKYGGRYESAFRKFETFGKLASKEFSNLFSSYALAYNKQQERKGNLFMHKFKRRVVTSEKYLRKLVHYIHYNPVAHDFCEKPDDWKYSSYYALLSQKTTLLKRDEVIEWFHDAENFIFCHRHPPDLSGID